VLAVATAGVVGLACVSGTVGFGSALLAAAFLWLAAAFALFAGLGAIVGLVAPLALLGLAGVPLLLWKASAETRFRQDLERTFSRYFSPQLVQRIMASPGSISLAGKRKELTILFSDIKGFTTMSETLDPDAVTELLRGYFDRMTEIVFRHGGVVDKFIGDGMLAFFGDPDWTEDHALKAVRAAMDMQREVRRFSDERKAAGLVPIEIRIGINSGWVTVGDLGASRRVEYTVIGRAVNLAQRLESNAPVGGILIGPRTHGLVKDQVTIVCSREVQAKGIDEPVLAYEVDCRL
jgi:class 3 adenylate cyclase